MKKILLFTLLAVLLFAVAGCAPGDEINLDAPDTTIHLTTPNPNPLVNKPDDNNRVAGFAQGLWHGLISPVTLIMSFFNEAMQIYEVHNNGRPYNIGFMVGVALVFTILGISGGRRR